MQFGNLGLHSANVYHVSREPKRLARLVGNSLLVSLGAGFAAALVMGLASWSGASWVPVRGGLLILALAAIPFGLAVLFFQHLLLGLQKVRDYNRSEIAQKVLAVAVLGTLIAVGRVTPLTVYAANALPFILILPWIWRKLSANGPLQAAPDGGLLREDLDYGFKAYLASLFSFLVLKVDLFLVPRYLGASGVGNYSVAVTLVDTLYQLPIVVGMILFPKLSALKDEGAKWTRARRAAWGLAGIMGLVCWVAYAAAPAAIPFVYGEAFGGAVPAFQVLLPALFLLSINTVFMNFFASIGMPPVTVWSPFLAAAANIALNLVWIPRWGLVGASWASVAAYGMMFLSSLAYLAYRRRKPLES